MQSFQELNNFGNTPVNYNTAQDYFIEFGNSLGNTSTTQSEDSIFNLQQQVPLLSLINPSNDVLVKLDFSNVSAVTGVTTQSALPGITVVQSTDTEWYITGVQTIEQYDSAWANVYVGLAVDNLTPFVVTTTVDDQRGNTRTWTESVTIEDNPLFASPAILYTSEDVARALDSAFEVTDSYGGSTDYQFTVTVTNQDEAQIEYGNTVYTDTLVLVESKIDMNAIFTNEEIVIRPASDFSGTTQIQVQLERVATGSATPVIDIPLVVSQDPEYYFPTPQYYRINQINTIDFAIVDLDAAANTYTVTISQTTNPLGTFRVDGTSVGNTITLTANRAVMNSKILTWQSANNFVDTQTFNFSQTKLLNNGNTVVQANAVPISIPCGISNVVMARTYFTDYYKIIFDTVTIGNVYDNCTVSLGTDSNEGVFAQYDADADVDLTANTGFDYYWVNSGTAANVQSYLNEVKFYTQPGYTGNVSVTFLVQHPENSGDFETSLALTLTPTGNGFVQQTETFIGSNASQTYTPSFVLRTYGKADIMVVGAGGGTAGSIDQVTGGGGGGGGVAVSANTILTNQSYAIQIGVEGPQGSGGTAPRNATAGNGGPTTAFGLTGGGGQRGTNIARATTPPGSTLQMVWTSNGGSAGSPTSNPGGSGGTQLSGFYPEFKGGGGGGSKAAAEGSGGAGSNGTATVSGAGGQGYLWVDGARYGAGRTASNGGSGAQGQVRLRWKAK